MYPHQFLLMKLPKWDLGMGRNTWINVIITVIGLALSEVGTEHRRKPVLFNYTLQSSVLKC